MKPFTQLACPHDDIMAGKLNMDVFAADLWQVANGKAPDDYQDPQLFLNKTYPTKGLTNIIDIARRRLEGKTGDSVIQLQTPFGGGKTHTLISLYHNAKNWGAKVVVFDGTALDPKHIKPWEELEKQLTNRIETTKGETSPGKETLIKIITENAPVLILVDELLTYVTKAAAIKIGDSNLASQTFAFIQELTGAVSTAGNSLLVLTLPSSVMEHYDENAEKVFQQLQKITGRTEKLYTPVEDDEIDNVIRKRLFNSINEKEVKKVVDTFIDYAKNESLLIGNEAHLYRERFLKSYPFKPEVVDTLYKKWGSYPTFQRTRGVLRLLSLLIYDLLNKNIPFIRLGDFNLKNNSIRMELVKHISQEWDSIIAQDITSESSGAKKVDESIGSSYKAYSLGTVTSTTIFMMSFSGKGVRDNSIKEIKLDVAHPDFPSNIIDTVIMDLKGKLFYLSDNALIFTNQPNLNRIILSNEENIADPEIAEKEKNILKECISKQSKFKIFLFPESAKDIPDNEEIKLIILKSEKPKKEILDNRTYRNILFFLCVDETERAGFISYLRRILALEAIYKNTDLNLTDSQKKEVEEKLKNNRNKQYEEIRKLYRKLFIPVYNDFKEIDLGMTTIGEYSIDGEVYNRLKSEGEILEKVAPKFILYKYLLGKDYVEVKKIYEASLKTPGEKRFISEEGFMDSIEEGVKEGLFGLGILINNEIKCNYFKELPIVNLTDDEIIIKNDLCVKPQIVTGGEYKPFHIADVGETHIKTDEKKEAIKSFEEKYKKFRLSLTIPIGQFSEIAKINTFLNTKFKKIDIKLSLSAEDGEIPVADYEDKVKESLSQANIKIDEEYKE